MKHPKCMSILGTWKFWKKMPTNLVLGTVIGLQLAIFSLLLHRVVRSHLCCLFERTNIIQERPCFHDPHNSQCPPRHHHIEDQHFNMRIQEVYIQVIAVFRVFVFVLGIPSLMLKCECLEVWVQEAKKKKRGFYTKVNFCDGRWLQKQTRCEAKDRTSRSKGIVGIHAFSLGRSGRVYEEQGQTFNQDLKDK